MVLDELVGVKVDPEVAKAVEAAGKALADMGHTVEPAHADMGGEATLKAMEDLFFFAFDSRLDGYAKRAGTKPGPDTLEPVIWSLYQHAKQHHAGALHGRRWAAANTARRKLGAFYTKYDIWLSPTTSRAVRAVGQLQSLQARRDGREQCAGALQDPCQYTHPAQHHGHAGHVAAAGHALVRRADRRADRRPPGRRAPPPAACGRAGAGDAVARPRAAAARLEAVIPAA